MSEAEGEVLKQSRGAVEAGAGGAAVGAEVAAARLLESLTLGLAELIELPAIAAE